MRIAVITCEAYRDAWKPFIALFAKFWPDCPYDLHFESDPLRESWCHVVLRVARQSDEPVLILQEDFFFSAPVEQSLIEHGLCLLTTENAGCVRLYPCPGGTEDIGDPYYAAIPRGATHRISCMAAIWNPAYLYEITRHAMWTTAEAGDFENLGTPYSHQRPEPVLAFKRELKPWPMDYLASAISRGLWNPDAIRLCDQYGIELDRSMRPVA